MPTLFTDPRSGGVKKSSGVNVLPLVKETWEEVRDESNPIDWLIAGYHESSKKDITVLAKGYGGLTGCSSVLPASEPIFGGTRLSNGKFITFFYADDKTSVMKKGRASMHKNGVLNTLEGSVLEIDIKPGMTEEDLESATLGVAQNRSSHCDTESNSVPNRSDSTIMDMHNQVEEQEYDKQDEPNAGTNLDKDICSEGTEKSYELMERKIKSIDINSLNNHDNMTNNDIDKPHSLSVPIADNKSTMLGLIGKSEHNERSSSLSTNNCGTTGTTLITIVPYDELKNVSDISNLPPGVDPLNREASLSDEEFCEVFEMEKQAFYNLPSWKRTAHKKAKSLF